MTSGRSFLILKTKLNKVKIIKIKQKIYLKNDNIIILFAVIKEIDDRNDMIIRLK